MNEQRIIIKDGNVTIMFNQYTFDPNGDDDLGKSRHYDHNVEIPDFVDKWTCHDCMTYWDESTAADYADEVALLEEDLEAERQAERDAEMGAENAIGGFYGDNGYNGFGDY